MSFTKNNNFEVPDGGVQNWDASLNENFELIEKGQTIKATAGEALTEGEVVYLNVSERLNLAISPTGSTTASQFLGFIQDSVVNEVDGYVQTSGNILYPHWAFTPGPVYLDSTIAGTITQTEPSTSTLVGYAIGTNELVIRPWVKPDHNSLSGLSGDDHTQYFRTDNVRSVTGITVTGSMQVNNITPNSEGWVTIMAGLTVGDLHVQGVTSGIPGGGGSSDHGTLTGLDDDDHTQYLTIDNARSSSGITVTGTLSVDNISPYLENWVSIQAGLTVGDLTVQGVFSGAGINAVVDDTTPQLGAALDTNSFSINESEGANVASATTTDIYGGDDGNTLHITGTTTITDFTDASSVGQWRKIIFDGILTLTHGSGITLPGSANITTAVGDYAFVYADTISAFTVLYFKSDGMAVVGSRTKKIQGTRDTTVASGTQAITGVGFQPKGCVFITLQDGSQEVSMTVVDEARAAGGMGQQSVGTFTTTSGAIYNFDSSGNVYQGNIDSWDSDGFTIDWVKTGSPTGTITWYGLLFE